MIPKENTEIWMMKTANLKELKGKQKVVMSVREKMRLHPKKTVGFSTKGCGRPM